MGRGAEGVPAVPNPGHKPPSTTPDAGTGHRHSTYQRPGWQDVYSNRPELLEQLCKVTVVLLDASQDDDARSKVTTESVVRSRRLRDRFSSEDLQSMIDLYGSGTTAWGVAEKFGVSLRSVNRLLHCHGVRRDGRSVHSAR